MAHLDVAEDYRTKTKALPSSGTARSAKTGAQVVLSWAAACEVSYSSSKMAVAAEPFDINGFPKSFVDRVLAIDAAPREASFNNSDEAIDWLFKH